MLGLYNKKGFKKELQVAKIVPVVVGETIHREGWSLSFSFFPFYFFLSSKFQLGKSVDS